MKTHLVSTAAAVLVPVVLTLGAAPAVAAADPGGNNGTIKLSEVGGPEDQSNDPKLSCSFEVQWYGFDKGNLYSTVSFEGQGADAKVGVTANHLSPVFIGEDAAGGGTDHDATQVYTLAFDAPPANAKAGYHVKITTRNDGAKGADTKFKVFHVEPCAVVTPPVVTPPVVTPPVVTPPVVDPPVVTPPVVDPPVVTPPVVDPPTDPVTSDPGVPTPAVVPWDWNWQYAAPACDALTVDYPSNIPSGQANDVNIRFATSTGQFSLNFHDNTGTWDGRTVFTYANHAQWPAGLTAYDVVWVQVGGTNYHWQGTVACGTSAPTPATPAPATPAPAAAVAEVLGFSTTTTVVRRGTAPQADWITVSATDADVVQVQQLNKGTWTSSRTAAVRADGTAKVTFPRLAKRGTYKFRVVVDGTATKTLKVKVR
ncbi:hypothetical protein [Nocardioides conyzicola]|uniref:Uncharacterized protein n=1 Tax=Nocardioides conyzicola TaxID=1651781 RepID=A0ABP8WYA8_9ACTN